MKRIPSPLLCLPLLLLLACGGSSHDSQPIQAPDKGPSYLNPPATGWVLVKNDALSKGKHLVLDLVGPKGQKGLGVALTLDLGPDSGKAAWAKVGSAGTLVENQAYDLGTAPQAFCSSATGGLLTLGVFAKGTKAVPVPYTATLIRVALDVAPNVPAGTQIHFAPVSADELTPAGTHPITVAVGTVTAE